MSWTAEELLTSQERIPPYSWLVVYLIDWLAWIVCEENDYETVGDTVLSSEDIWRLFGSVVPCYHCMARPHVADREHPLDVEGNFE